jgi:hypothetical protein
VPDGLIITLTMYGMQVVEIALRNDTDTDEKSDTITNTTRPFKTKPTCRRLTCVPMKKQYQGKWAAKQITFMMYRMKGLLKLHAQ